MKVGVAEDSKSVGRRKGERGAGVGECLYTVMYPTSSSIAILNQPLRRGSCNYPAYDLAADPLYVHV
jgi:hypothetical protein